MKSLKKLVQGVENPHGSKRIKDPESNRVHFVPQYMVDYIEPGTKTVTEQRNLLPTDAWQWTRNTRAKKKKDSYFMAVHSSKKRKTQIMDET